MLRRSVVAVLVGLLVIMTGAWVQQAIAQEGGERERGQRDPEQMRQRMEEMRQRMSQMMKETLGATDEEWKVLQPKIEKIQTLSRQSRGGMGGMFGRRGGPGGQPGGQPQPERPPSDQPQSEVEKAGQALRTVLENKEAKPEEIKAALGTLRAARAKAKQDLETAQKELREVVTVRQEAQLVSMGVLE